MFTRFGYRNPTLFDELFQMQREMDRFWRGNKTASRCGVFPPLNIYDDGESLLVRAEIPGIDPKEIEIEANANSLSIKGERKPKETENQGSAHRREREFGTFHRTVDLPQDIDPDKVKASYKLGILEIVLPKAAASLPKKVEILAN